jgi:hypothetical protein
MDVADHALSSMPLHSTHGCGRPSSGFDPVVAAFAGMTHGA